jgi:hypothetical protein
VTLHRKGDALPLGHRWGTDQLSFDNSIFANVTALLAATETALVAR